MSHKSIAEFDDQLIEVRINCPNPWVADAIAAMLLRKCLVGAVNRINSFSSYRWGGVSKSRDETILLGKTRASLFDDVASETARQHPFDTPSISAISLDYVTERYRDWILSQTSEAAHPEPIG